MRIALLIVIFSNLVTGQIGGSSYLKLGMDARGISMGRSLTSLAEGPSAVYWNPAGVHTTKKFKIGLIATNLLDASSWSQNYQTLAVSMSWWRVGLGFGALHYGVSEIPEYDHQMNYLGDFTDQELTGIISFAFDFPGFMTIGISGIYSQQQYSGLTQWSNNSESGWGVNFGLRIIPLPNQKNIRVGMLINNRNPVGTVDSTGLFTHLGVEWRVIPLLDQDYLSSMTITLGMEQEHNYPLKLNSGIEVMLAKFSYSRLLGRIGIDDFILEMRPLDVSLKEHAPELSKQIRRLNRKFTIGIGIEQSMPRMRNLKLVIDYAVVKETFRVIHFFTIGMDF